MRVVRFTEAEYRHLLNHLTMILDPETYLGSQYADVTWTGKDGETTGMLMAVNKMLRTERAEGR